MANRSAYSYYPKLWQKSYLLEIIRKDTGIIYKSFAFSLPPESIHLEIPQRVNITKTFGGIFVDDYGIDSAQITIAGSTGNSQLKEVYDTGASYYMDGKSEAYYVLEEIMQYKRNSTNYDKFELRIYDLSSVATEFIDYAQPATWNVDGWVVVLKEGQITRSKERPMWYNYQLNFIGIEPIGRKHYTKFAGYTSMTIEKIFAGIEDLRSKADSFKKLLAKYQSIIDKVKIVEEVTNNLEAAARDYYEVTQGFVTTTIDGINSVFDITSFPSDLAGDLITAATDLRDEVELTWQTIVDNWTDVETKNANIQSMANNLFSIEQNASDIRAAAKSVGVLPEVTIVPADAPGSIKAVNATDPTSALSVGYLLTYGYHEMLATSETRLDVLSVQAYGTPDYADTLAAYNGITGDTEITPGMTLKIPYLSYTQAVTGNEIYDSEQNIYGTDILLSENGDLTLAEFNDYATISGVDNIGQAVSLRTAERQGARIRLDTYGIKNVGGGFDAFSVAVLVTSIRESLLQDPRIRQVQRFSFDIQGDALVIDFWVDLEVGGTAKFSVTM